MVPIHMERVGGVHPDTGPAQARGRGTGGAGEGQGRAGARQGQAGVRQGGNDEGRGVAGMSKGWGRGGAGEGQPNNHPQRPLELSQDPITHLMSPC